MSAGASTCVFNLTTQNGTEAALADRDRRCRGHRLNFAPQPTRCNPPNVELELWCAGCCVRKAGVESFPLVPHLRGVVCRGAEVWSPVSEKHACGRLCCIICNIVFCLLAQTCCLHCQVHGPRPRAFDRKADTQTKIIVLHCWACWAAGTTVVNSRHT